MGCLHCNDLSQRNVLASLRACDGLHVVSLGLDVWFIGFTKIGRGKSQFCGIATEPGKDSGQSPILVRMKMCLY